MESSKTYLTRADWADDVKRAINDFIDDYDEKDKGYAVFDFDNTITIFDIEDQILEYQIENMAFAITPDRMQEVLLSEIDDESEAFAAVAADIADAYSALWERYGGFNAAGVSDEIKEKLAKDEDWLEFNAKMINLFSLVYKLMAPQTADKWMYGRFSGMKPEEIYNLTMGNLMQNRQVETHCKVWESPDIKSRSGRVSEEWTYGINVSENMKELIRTLDANGIDVWICSASDVDAVRAGLDGFGLHDSVTGVLGMTPKTDVNGCILPEYDLESGCGYYSRPDGVWEKMERPQKAVTCEGGKVTAIRNAIAPEYEDKGPIAGFMDSEGDFAFCTEFETLKLVMCINRANRKATDGGSIIARAAIFEKLMLGYNYKAARKAGDVMYVLQGRNEQGLRCFINSNMTLLYGADEPALFTRKENAEKLEEELRNCKSVKEIIKR